MQESDLVEVSNDYTEGYEDYDDYWGNFAWAGTGLITYRAEGNLRQMVLSRLGMTSGEVLVEENHVDIGYCPSCTSEVTHIRITVDGEKVWGYDYAYDNPFKNLQNWLTEENND